MYLCSKVRRHARAHLPVAICEFHVDFLEIGSGSLAKVCRLPVYADDETFARLVFGFLSGQNDTLLLAGESIAF
jgi:hypothetical protein